MKDWQIRAIKTFVQAFGGVFIPQIACVLSGTLPADFSGWGTVLIPLLCASLAAGISAAWNVTVEFLKEGDE